MAACDVSTLKCIVSLSTVTALGQECAYKYTRQPPTILNCNPFNRLELTCTIKGPKQDFSIIWVRRSNNGYVGELQVSAQGIDISVRVSVRSIGSSASVTYTSQLTLIGLDEVDGVGEYWCQIRFENGTPLNEKSNILTIGPAVEYQDLKHCMAGDGQASEQVKCLKITAVTGAMDGIASTNPEHEFQMLFNSESLPTFQTTLFNLDSLPTFQTTSDHTEEQSSGSDRNLYVMYATLAAAILSLVITLLIVVVIATLIYKRKSNRESEENKQPEFKAKQPSHNHQSSPMTQHEKFDFMENVAYSEVGKYPVKDSSSSFVTSDLTRSASSPEYDDILTLH